MWNEIKKQLQKYQRICWVNLPSRRKRGSCAIPRWGITFLPGQEWRLPSRKISYKGEAKNAKKNNTAWFNLLGWMHVFLLSRQLTKGFWPESLNPSTLCSSPLSPDFLQCSEGEKKSNNKTLKWVVLVSQWPCLLWVTFCLDFGFLSLWKDQSETSLHSTCGASHVAQW